MNALSWAAVIPAYNAAQTIAKTISQVADHIAKDRILVVDDGSTDATLTVVRGTGAAILQRAINGGKGLALREGFHHALEWHTDWIITLDADGQHDPAAIPQFQRIALNDEFDLLIGNRMGDLCNMPPARQFSNRVSSTLLSWRTGRRLPDVQCGFRAIKTDLLPRLRLEAKRYDIEVEMILQAWRLGGRIGWVGIPTIYRGEISFLRKFPETMRFLRLLMRSFYAQDQR